MPRMHAVESAIDQAEALPPSMLAGRLDALGAWRHALEQRLAELQRFLSEHELLDDAAADIVEGLRRRLGQDRLVLAFVAEFSRGKSELINAIFFADAGRRVLPATPGRTTMCPVELAYEPHEPPHLSLLSIDTRLEAPSLAELRAQPRAWKRVLLDVTSPEQLSSALLEVMRTQWVAVERARELGLWDDERPEDNPPRRSDGLVEVPAWRHALINYPHPLLKRGLVVLDTPGLNAIGAEPELTLSLLPSAHAVVFVLGADTGVTKSDLGLWRDHIGAQAMSRYVVLNKIDTLADPLLAPEAVRAQIEQQRRLTADTLDVPIERVFPLSARVALSARVKGDAIGLAKSRLPELESALAEQLLPQRRQVLEEMVGEGARALEAQVGRRLADRRRQIAEQMLELRGLRGKSGGKVKLMLDRVERDSAEFEQCTARLAALRAVHARMLRETLVPLASEQLRDEVARMQEAIDATLFNLGAKKAFVALCERLRGTLAGARGRCEEIHDMLGGSFKQLNTDFGFALTLMRAPNLQRYVADLDLIERSYGQYLGLSHALRLSEPRFMEQFRRMLLSKLRMVFENASNEVELWNRQATSQIDSQLRERRRSFRRRREALERIQTAAGELEQRIGELETADHRWQSLLTRVAERIESLRDGVRFADEAEAAVSAWPAQA
jgi:hypothetical protein